MRRLALVLAVLAPLAAASQPMQPAAAPVAGTLRPTAGAGAETLAFTVRAQAESGVDGCVGYVVPDAPDAVVEWDGGDLRIWGRADFDATLLVTRPDGTWACNDDADGTAPAVDLDGAPAGRYAVWLGAFAPDPFETNAALYAGTPPPPPALDASAPPRAGVLDVHGGFEEAQGLLEVAVDAGGGDAAPALDLSGTSVDGLCTGYLDAARPTAGVAFAGAQDGTGLLVIEALSNDNDLVLLVQAPDGSIACNDDAGGTDPRVVIEEPADGLYLAWVGTFGPQIAAVPATLVIAETAPDPVDEFTEGPFEPVPFTEGTYTPLDLSLAPRYALTLRSTEETQDAEAAIQPALLNPVQGGACSGYIEAAPTTGIRLEGDGPFALTASSENDLVLLVHTPGGRWFCSDDADGLNPGVQIDVAEAGVYKVWAGSFAEGQDPVHVVVSATRGELVVSEGEDGFTSHSDPQSGGSYDGTEIRPDGARTSIDSVPATVVVEAGGSVLNPVEGAACAGFISERPTASLTAGGDLTVAAEADDDTDLTLVVRTADGAWFCSDDAEGTVPEVRIPGAPAAVHAVWVGTFSRRSTPPRATLTITTTPPPPPASRD